MSDLKTRIDAANAQTLDIIRGGKQEDLEGSPNPRTVVVRFDSFEQARKWYYSAEYEKPKALRQAASSGNAVLVEGV